MCMSWSLGVGSGRAVSGSANGGDTCHPVICHSPNALFTALTRELPDSLWWWISFLWGINLPVPHCNTLQNALLKENSSLTYKSWCISLWHPRQNNGPRAPPYQAFPWRDNFHWLLNGRWKEWNHLIVWLFWSAAVYTLSMWLPQQGCFLHILLRHMVWVFPIITSYYSRCSSVSLPAASGPFEYLTCNGDKS